MTRRILALRVARRALGAAVIKEEGFTLLDGRHLSSRRETMTESVRKYLNDLVAQQEPTGVMILAPDERYDDRGILRDVQTALAQGGHPMRIVRLPELLRAFGSPTLETREQLWETAQGILPELQNLNSSTKPYVVEAAALALYAEALLTLLTP